MPYRQRQMKWRGGQSLPILPRLPSLKDWPHLSESLPIRTHFSLNSLIQFSCVHLPFYKRTCLLSPISTGSLPAKANTKQGLPPPPSFISFSLFSTCSLLHHPISPLLGMKGRASCMIIYSESFNLPFRPRLAVDRSCFSLSGLDVILGAVQFFKALLLSFASCPFSPTISHDWLSLQSTTVVGKLLVETQEPRAVIRQAAKTEGFWDWEWGSASQDRHWARSQSSLLRDSLWSVIYPTETHSHYWVFKKYF